MNTIKSVFLAIATVIIKFFGRLISTVQSDFIYILMAMILPVLLLYVGQGTELISGIAEYKSGLNMLAILVSFYILFYAIWVVPIFGIDVLKGIDYISNWLKPNKEDTKRSKADIALVFQQTANFYNTGSSDGLTRYKFPMRYLANLPLSLFLMVFTYENLGLNLGFTEGIIGLVIYLIILYSIFYFTQGIYRPIYKKLNNHFKKSTDAITGMAFNILLLSMVWLMWTLLPTHKWVSILFCYLFLILNNSYHYLVEVDTTTTIDFKNKYRILIGIFIAMAMSMLLFSNFSKQIKLHLISPIIIGNMLFAFYILTMDCLLTAPSTMAKYYYKDDDEAEGKYKRGFLKFVNYVILFFILKSFISNKSIIHDVHREDSVHTVKEKRQDLSTYFADWKKTNRIDSTTDTILLVAGQGGGSRAGAWIYYHLNKMDQRKIFAISTVSGSSNGANNYIFKKYLNALNINDTIPNLDRQTLNLYTYNFLSQSFWGLLFRDGLNYKCFMSKAFDRNYYHQRDEMKSMKAQYDYKHHRTIDSLFKQDCINKYHPSDPAYGRLPILLTNTATTQTGMRAVCSPVNTGKLFTATPDVYAKFKEAHPTSNLLSHTCVDMSQSFPFTSSYTYLSTVGNFIDGGLYDNSGANTLYELYTSLKHKHPSQKFKIVLVQSDSVKPKEIKESASLLLSTLASAANSPFTGHANYWSEKIKEMARQKNDAFEEIILSKYNRNIPLGIYLTSITVDSINAAGDRHWNEKKTK